MENNLKNAFKDIKADSALLEKTSAYLEHYRTGINKSSRSFRPQRIMVVFAAMLVLAIGIFGYSNYYMTVSAYVSIDVNPSLELRLNDMNKVIGAKAYNEDAEHIIEMTDINNNEYDQAVAKIITTMKQEGYFSDDSLVTITVQSENKKKERDLCNSLLHSANEQIIGSDSFIEVFPVSADIREAADALLLSASKYIAIVELMEVDETATIDEYRECTTKQIKERTRECMENHSSGSSDTGSGNGHKNGQNDTSENHGKGQSDSSVSNHDSISGNGAKHGNGSGDSGKHGNNSRNGSKHGK